MTTEEGRNSPDSCVHTSRDDLRVRLLTFHVCDGRSMSGKDHRLGFCSHIPNTYSGIPASGYQDIQRGMLATGGGGSVCGAFIGPTCLFKTHLNAYTPDRCP